MTLCFALKTRARTEFGRSGSAISPRGSDGFQRGARLFLFP